MKPIFTLEKINRLVKPLADKYRAEEIYIFGSYARGEADEDNDLDFLVYGGEGTASRIITAYFPSPDKWEDDLMTRKEHI